MNRNCYRLVRNGAAGIWTPVAEFVRRRGKGNGPAFGLLAMLGIAPFPAAGELPVPCGACATVPGFVSNGSANYTASGNQALVSQVGNKAILNWQSFNVSQGSAVTFQQVQDLATLSRVAGAEFNTLNRIWQADPSVIAGAINVAAGQKGNLTFINQNGIVFTGTAQLDVNTLTASSLGLADNFFLDQLINPSNTKPQFEGTTGFVKVLEGARITAATNGRVMLLAPTVTNSGRIETPEGQTILGAGAKVYLSSSDDPNLRGLLIEVDRPVGATGADGKADYDQANPSVPAQVTIDGQSISLGDAHDKLGHATNLGGITATRGNVTMAGLAVNQMGRASATTSVLLNGSVFLKAGDDVTTISKPGESVRIPVSRAGGRVTLGEGSRTSVMADLDEAKLKLALDRGDLTQSELDAYLGGDADPTAFLARYMSDLTSLDTAAFAPSRVTILGQDIRMQGGAGIRAPAGEVGFLAVDNPSQLGQNGDPLITPGAAESATARLHIEAGASVDVSGLTDVALPVSRNYLEVRLLGDELKDSPLNRGADSAIRGSTVWVDVGQGAPLIANLKDHQAGIGRSIAERSTAGGTIELASQGEAVLPAGVALDVSGGNMLFTPDHVRVSKLVADGQTYDLADAPSDIRYDAVATQFTVDYGRWGVQETFDLAETRYNPGYREGNRAGTVELNARRAYFGAAILGNTVVGEFQAQAGEPPAGARLVVGRPDTRGNPVADFGLLQTVALGAGSAPLPAGFGFGSALPEDLRERLALDARLFGGNGVNRVDIYSNESLSVEQPIALAAGGAINLTADKVTVNADVTAPAGQIGITATALTEPLAQLPTDPAWISIGDGVTLSTRGRWINQSLDERALTPRTIHAGDITLAATSLYKDGAPDTGAPLGNLAIGADVRFDVSGGGYLAADGERGAGNGGDLTLSFRHLGGSGGMDALQDHIVSGSLGDAGTLNVAAAQISVGNGTGEAGELRLNPGFFSQGFSSYKLTGLGGVTVKEGTDVAVVTESRDLLPTYLTAATDTPIETFSTALVREDVRREAADLKLAATLFKDRVGLGDGTFHDLIVESGAELRVDPGASIDLSANRRVVVEGMVHAPAGTINVALNEDDSRRQYDPSNAIWLSANSHLSVAGVAQVFPDEKGLMTGDVLPAGEISLDAGIGFLVAEAGAVVDLRGAPPTHLDVPNEAGGLGMTVSGDAGTLNLYAREGILMDATMLAAGGGQQARGGAFSLALGPSGSTDQSSYTSRGFPEMNRVVSLRDTSDVLPANLKPGDALPGPVGGEGFGYVDLPQLQDAGFDRVQLRSRDIVRFDQDIPSGDPLALAEIELDASQLDVNGHTAALAAQVVRIGNLDGFRQQHAFLPTAGSGELTVNAGHIDLLGHTAYSGAASLNYNSSGEIRASGVQNATAPGRLNAVADIGFNGTVSPGSSVKFTIETTGDVNFLGATAPIVPLSAFGELTVKAANITNRGAVLAPYGNIEFEATGKVDLAPGSVTSTAGLSQGIVPFGTTLNGREWEGLAGTLQAPLPVKSVSLKGADVILQQGAIVDLSGAGDIQAWEFTPGPGGSTDVLAEPGTYAILPGYRGIVAPYDTEAFGLEQGDTVYLSGAPGLEADTYTLLPAHYALLPGAYMISLDTGRTDVLPGQGGVKQDGVLLVPGYLTDSRHAAGGPRDGRWTGFELLSHENVLTRAEYTLTRASEFFADDTLGGRPGDAGNLSIQTLTGLTLDALVKAGTSTGRGASLDISAPKLAVVGAGAAGAADVDPAALRLDPVALSKIGAESLLLGGVRSQANDATAIQVGAGSVEVANGSDTGLAAREVMLAATDRVQLYAGSSIIAEGETGDAGTYTLTGNGALLRAAATDAAILRDGGDGSGGDLLAADTVNVTSSNAVVLDATRNNAYRGAVAFEHNGATVAGKLTAGASRISFGDVPAGTEGLAFSREQIAAFNQLSSLSLRSNGGFDFYGSVELGGVASDQSFLLDNLTLNGNGIFGYGANDDSVRLNAAELRIANPGGAMAGTATGSGTFEAAADRLVLGDGRITGTRDLTFRGFDAIDLKANSALQVAGKGTANFDAPGTRSTDGVGLNLAAGTIGAEGSADYSLVTTGAVALDRLAGGAPAGSEGLGASLDVTGTSVTVGAEVKLPSGRITLHATDGDLVLTSAARVSTAGTAVQFFDHTSHTSGGEVVLIADRGGVETQSGSEIDVSVDSAAVEEAAGLVRIEASNGEAVLAGAMKAHGPAGSGGSFEADVGQLNPDAALQNDFSGTNALLETGGFTQARRVRVRQGDVAIAAGDTVNTRQFALTADRGKIDVFGRVNGAGAKGGEVELHARDDVALHAGSTLDVHAAGAREDGGRVVLSSSAGSVTLEPGSAINVAAGDGGVGGEVFLRAARNSANNDLAISAIGAEITGAEKVVAEGFKTYVGGTITAADIAATGAWFTDASNFMINTAAIEARLGVQADKRFQLLPGIDITSSTDLSLNNDWTLHSWRYDPDSGALVTDPAQLASGLDDDGNSLTAGVLSLRAQGKLTIGASLSDGFDSVAPTAGLQGGESWNYRLVSGADPGGADPMAVVAGSGDFALNAGKLIRSGRGDIDIAAGGSFDLGKSFGVNAPTAVIYTAGSKAADLDVFDETYKDVALGAGGYFPERGGDLRIAVAGDLRGAISTQLYSSWLYRTGKVNADGNFTLVPPGSTNNAAFASANPQTAWWIDFASFQQGIAALGGGDVEVQAGGKVEHLSASVATNGRMDALTPDPEKLVVRGGGDLTVSAGSDILSGQFYVADGDLSLKAGGAIGSGRVVNNNPIYPVIALGDAQARLDARGDIGLHSVIDPLLLPQSTGSGFNISIPNTTRYKPAISYFGSYTGNTSLAANSLAGSIELGAAASPLLSLYNFPSQSSLSYNTDLVSLAPATIEAQAFGGDVRVGSIVRLHPAATGGLSLLAKHDVTLNHNLVMLESDPALLPTAETAPETSGTEYMRLANLRSLTPIHQGDPEPVRILAAEGDIEGGGALTLAKRSELRAGRDILFLSLQGQNLADTDISRVSARRDLIFRTENNINTGGDGISLGGPGLLDISAGRNLDLGTSKQGIVSRGNLDNAGLPASGADIRVTVGVPGGLDYVGALERLEGSIDSAIASSRPLDDATLWQVRWLSGDDSLNDPTQALAVVHEVQEASGDAQEIAVRNMLFTALQTTGTDFNDPQSEYAGSYERGFATLERVFPGIDERDALGASKNYRGELNLFASKIKTEDGGDIEFLVPGGQAVVGLTKVPAFLSDPIIAGTLGLVAVGEGDVRGMAYDDILVNQSRILTVGGGDVLLWSSQGDIDAGKGKRTATNVPPPISRLDPVTGALVIELQGAATGSGIGALAGQPGVEAGDVSLIAPNGAVNAGDAGIRATNLTIAAQVVLNAENIQVSGSSVGAPVADTSGLSAGLAGNTLGDSQATKDVTRSLSDQSQVSRRLSELTPGLVIVEVLGFGDDAGAPGKSTDNQ